MGWTKSSQISFSSKKEYNCEDATFPSIFDRKGRFEIGLLTKSLGSSCGLIFFNERLNSQFEGSGDIILMTN